ncbi:MAG TPA: hypothetical protein VFM32_02685 [Spongiibacteraceae bacterium]|nr:hypothetical protein [Spongiibacteraceae bacterium]
MFESLPAQWIRIAVIYFVAAVLLGVFMGASGDHSLFPLHAHMNLLGWVSMVLFGLLGKAFPGVANNLLAKLHFWIYNASLPVMVFALYGVLRGNAAMEPLLGIVSATTAIAILLFAINVLLNLQKTAKTNQSVSAATSVSGRLTHS